MKTPLYFTASVIGIAFAFAPQMAAAQSTGSVAFEEEDIVVVTGNRDQDVIGVEVPDTPKAKQVLSQEIISRQAPGQTVNDIINLIPGVSFQNNDAFGSAGGTLNIRGFDSSRVSQTFDGVPLNDTGNYALYSNQQLDPELIEQVNVNFGSTDIDSPTASATGSTVNYRTRLPKDDFGVQLSGAAGDFSFFRVFGAVDTGEITSFGTKMFFSASKADNNNIYGAGKIDKQQYNARLYQPIGLNGDFISISGHYNENRNNFFGSVSLASFPTDKDDRNYDVGPCTVDLAQAGVADSPNRCGTSFDERVNPSNTGNIRIASKFTLMDNLTLTVDPSYQYVKANGGGTRSGREGFYDIDPSKTNAVLRPGYFGGNPYAGVDLNGDGDTLDQVTVLTPSQTQTHRYGLLASLNYKINDEHIVRLAYSFDRGRHRQTGQVGYVQYNGQAVDPFPVNDPILDSNGVALQKRDRLSYAILNQISGEYRGKFFEEKLNVTLGLRAPFFKRDLTNYCFTTSASGFVDCTGQNEAVNAEYAALNPNASAPQNRELTYDKLLPSAGFVYKFTPEISTFFNYSRGLQVPGTDNLYNSFFFAANTPEARPIPETTDNFDLGLRFTNDIIQAQLVGWYTNYKDRLASAYDPVLDRSVYRNLGTVHKYGIDGSIAIKPVDFFSVYAWGSYLKSDIQADVQTGTNAAGAPVFAETSGKRESGAPKYTLGVRGQFNFGPVEVGGQVKRTGERQVNDINTAQVPGYTLVDFDARVNLEFIGLNKNTFFQLNLLNAFDKLYVGGFGGDLESTTPFVNIGYPRTFMGSFVIEY